MKLFFALLLTAGTALASPDKTVDALSREYIHLSLSMGAHDANYVDAYYGPANLQEEATKAKLSLADIKTRAQSLQAALTRLPIPADTLHALRLEFLKKQLTAMLGRIDLVQGKKLPFDAESALLYDTVAPRHDLSHFQSIIGQIDALLPGPGTTAERVSAFRKQFIIPRDRLKPVFDAAIQACREQTLKHITLPEGENFTLEFVTGKPWSGYNWYKGNYHSLIQINVELPIYIDRAIDLGCHEGYPGHHTYNALLEKNLVVDRQWLEFSVYPLFSPQSLIAEGTANYGIDMAFSETQKQAVERDVLYPLAGIDPALREKYTALQKLIAKLSYAGNEAARNYLDGKASREQTIDWLINVELYPAEKAPQRTTFYDTYRSYVINYNVGKDLVKTYVEANSPATGVEADDTAQRWQVFEQLLSSPRLPSSLKAPR